MSVKDLLRAHWSRTIVYKIREHCSTEKLCSLNFHVVTPNATKYITKLNKKVL